MLIRQKDWRKEVLFVILGTFVITDKNRRNYFVPAMT